MPMLSDIRDAGSVGRTPTSCCSCTGRSRPTRHWAPEWQDYAKCSLAKARDGETGLFPLAYYGKITPTSPTGRRTTGAIDRRQDFGGAL